MLMPIAKGMFMIEAPNWGRFPHCHCLYLEGAERVLIDTSMGEDNLKIMQSKNIDLIINSHFHEDHILYNNAFVGAQIWAHALDAPAMRDLEVFCDYYGFGIWGHRELGLEFIRSINLKASLVHKELEDNQELHINGQRWRVIHTPGHTPGHCAFFNEKTGILYSGDIDLSGFGPWYGHVCSDVDDFIHSIKKLAALDAAIVVSSHKGIINEDIADRFQKYLKVLYLKEEKLLDFLHQPRELEEIVNQQIIYGPQVKFDDNIRFWERLSVYVHLQRLIKLGLVAVNAQQYQKK